MYAKIFQYRGVGIPRTGIPRTPLEFAGQAFAFQGNWNSPDKFCSEKNRFRFHLRYYVLDKLTHLEAVTFIKMMN